MSGTCIHRIPSGPSCLRTFWRRGAGRTADQRAAHSLWSWSSHLLGNTVVILLCGEDKGSQAKDITTANRLLDEWMK
jgi:hypothetical protein